MNSTKTLLSLILIGLIAGGGYWGYQQYETKQREETLQQANLLQRQKAIEVLKQGIPVLEKFNELNRTTTWFTPKIQGLFNPIIIQQEKDALLKIEQQPPLSNQLFPEVREANEKYLAYNQFISQMIAKVEQINKDKDSIIAQSDCLNPYFCNISLTNAFLPSYIQGINALQQKNIIPPVNTSACDETTATTLQKQFNEQLSEQQNHLTTLQNKINNLSWYEDKKSITQSVEKEQKVLKHQTQAFSTLPIESVQFVCKTYQNFQQNQPVKNVYLTSLIKDIDGAEALRQSNKIQSCATQHKEQCNNTVSTYLSFQIAKTKEIFHTHIANVLKQKAEQNLKDIKPGSGDEFANRLTQGVIDINQSKNQQEVNTKMDAMKQMLAENEKKVLAEQAKNPQSVH